MFGFVGCWLGLGFVWGYGGDRHDDVRLYALWILGDLVLNTNELHSLVSARAWPMGYVAS